MAVEKQIPCGDDNKKSKGNDNSKGKGNDNVRGKGPGLKPLLLLANSVG